MSPIVAVVGALASGKDALAHYLLQKHDVGSIEVGAFARQLAEEAAKEEPKAYNTSAKKMAEHGPEYVITYLVEEICQSEEWQSRPLVITGVRTPAEATMLKEQFGSDLLMAYIHVGDQEKRFEHVQTRNFTTDPDDFQDFVQQDESMKDEYALGKTAELADVILQNDGSLEQFYQQIEDKIVPHLQTAG